MLILQPSWDAHYVESGMSTKQFDVAFYISPNALSALRHCSLCFRVDFTAAFDVSRIAARIFKELAGDADSYTPNFPPTHSRLPTVMPPPGAPAFPDQSGPVDVIKQNKELKPTGSVRYQKPADPGAKDKKHKIVLQEHEDPAVALPVRLPSIELRSPG